MKPSSSGPPAAKCSSTTRMTISSGTSSPVSMKCFTSSPVGVPCATADAEDIAGRQVLDAVVRGEERSLRALAGARLAEQHEAYAGDSHGQVRKPS